MFVTRYQFEYGENIIEHMFDNENGKHKLVCGREEGKEMPLRFAARLFSDDNVDYACGSAELKARLPKALDAHECRVVDYSGEDGTEVSEFVLQALPPELE